MRLLLGTWPLTQPDYKSAEAMLAETWQNHDVRVLRQVQAYVFMPWCAEQSPALRPLATRAWLSFCEKIHTF